MDLISTAFAAPIERDLRAQTKDARSRTQGYSCPGRVSQSSEMTAMSRARTEPTIPSEHETLLARGGSGAWRAAGRREAHMGPVAETEREVTTPDLPPATARLLIDIFKVMGAGKGVTLVPME